MIKKLVLFSTAGCHLCDLAEALLQQLNPELISYEIVDISDSDSLVDQYGIRIPVLQDPDSAQELGWPFDQEQLLDFLDSLDWD